MASTEIVPANAPGLIPFKPGHDTRQRARPGKPSPLNNPEYVELFALAVADGMTNADLAETFRCGATTVQTYKRDPRVRAAAMKHIEARVLRIHRKVDSQIEQRLEQAHEIDTATLLKIRKEFLGGVMRAQAEGGKTDEKTINQAQEAIEANPNFAAELREFIETNRVKVPVERDG